LWTRPSAGNLQKQRFDKLSANAPYETVTYPFMLSLSKNVRMVFRGSLPQLRRKQVVFDRRTLHHVGCSGKFE
jgi:hypothetical protein